MLFWYGVGIGSALFGDIFGMGGRCMFNMARGFFGLDFELHFEVFRGRGISVY